MDADEIVVFTEQLGRLDMSEDLLTLVAMRQRLEAHILMMDADRLAQWRMQGWRPNAPGLTCQMCGGKTWGRQDGNVEYVKCVAVTCGVMRQVLV